MSYQRPNRGRGTQSSGTSWRRNNESNTAGSTGNHPDPAPPSARSQQQRGQSNQHEGGGRGRGWSRGRGRGASRLPELSRMDLMASVSRSSGLEKDGDDLKNFRIQEEYREFVQGKLDAYRKQFPLEIRTHDKRRIDAQENVLILFRKLREGVFASKRRDGMALEVYETSFYLSVIFNSAKQIAAAMSHLVPDAYQTLTCPKPLCRPTVVLSLLYHLVASYPSQASYHRHMSAIPPSLLPRQSGAYSWIQSLASALRARNYSKFSQFYKKQSLAAIFEDSTPAGDKSNTQLVKVAMLAILDDLRSKARDTSWAVLRSAYRELDTSADKTSAWLTTSLSLQPLLVTDDRTWTAEGWLNEQSPRGHTRQKEGIQGKWIICKVR